MCTCFKIKAKDSSVVVGRTMEFGIDLKSQITVFPREYKYQGLGPAGKPGLSWTGKYGVVGMDALGMPLLTDGINEEGLYVGDLYLPGFAKYQQIPEGSEANAISQLDVAGYLLSNCKTVAEAKEAISKVLVFGMVVPELQLAPPVHYAVHDATGASAVFEYLEGQLKITDNPVGVLTNSPYFDWHLINLRNYVNLSANNVPELNLDSENILPIGQGSGMLGLPGDATPPSRFVRAVAFTQATLKAENANDATKNVLHILNNFDIPKGFAREERSGQEVYDYTSWSSIADLSGKVYYLRGYDNPKIYATELSNLDFTASEVKRLDTSNSDWFTKVA